MSPSREELRDSARAKARAGLLRVAPPLRRLVAQRDDARRRSAALRRTAATLERRVEDLVAQRARLSNEVTQLRAGRPVDDYRFLFIVAYGRSGSTLVQGILNSIPGYLIRGENADAFYRLGSWHRVLVAARSEHAAAITPTYAWYGIGGYDVDAALTLMRSLAIHTLLRPEPDTRVIGYKEIRWWHSDWVENLTFLRELFPGARFILNTRNHENVAKSKWWAERPDTRERLEKFETQLEAMAEFLGADGYRLNFDEFVVDPEVLRGLFDWLGEEFDRERIDAVLAVKHSS